jgi:hypothetical protein
MEFFSLSHKLAPAADRRQSKQAGKNNISGARRFDHRKKLFLKCPKVAFGRTRGRIVTRFAPGDAE